MSITLITERPNPVVRAGDGPGILYNRDPNTPLYIGSNSSIVNGNYNSASILDPMSSIYVAGDTDIWACAPVGTTPDNAIAVDFIHSGRSQHYTSPAVLTETIDSIPATIGTSVASNLTPILQEILNAINNLNPGDGNGVTPVTANVQIYQGVTWTNFSASGTRQLVNTGTFAVPSGATGITFLINASGQMSAVAGIMLEIQYAIDSANAVIIPLQTGYQGGQATLSGNFSQVISVAGATSVTYAILITCTTGTWTNSGTTVILCQMGA